MSGRPDIDWLNVPDPGQVIAIAGFLAGENKVKIFNESPEEDSLAERRAEQAAV